MSEAGNKTLHLLLVEDAEDDAFLLLRQLKKAGFDTDHIRVDNRGAMQSALESRKWDLVITDHNMPEFSSGEALALVRAHDRDVPIIIVSGSMGEEIAVDAMKSGANDYIMKDNLARLIPAVQRELREAKQRQEHRKAQELIHHMAYHDSLTGLVNRNQFERCLNDALTQSRSEGIHHILLYIDLDQFKIVNDTCGHIAGDELLKRLAPLLRRSIRNTDTLARLGGDEFGVLLENCSFDHGMTVANNVLRNIQDFRFSWQDKLFTVGASIGMAAIDAGCNGVGEALSCADMACYAAKDRGRNRIHVYTANDQAIARRHGEMQWVARINDALDHDHFVLHRQSIEPLRQGSGGAHYEVLIRMDDGQGGLIQPAMFIPAAERYNLMGAIDKWVINKGLDYLQQQQQRGGAIDSLFINLSGLSLGDAEMGGFIEDAVRSRGLRPDRIGFEVTETAAIADFGNAVEFAQRIKGLGCHFALDDFGSGLSSFGYLKSIPIDYIKIDGTFVRNMLADTMDLAIVESINQIGHVVGLKTIAEFVETPAIRSRLEQVGVDYVQGYGIARPQALA